MPEKYVSRDHLHQFQDSSGSELLDRRNECLRCPGRYYDCAALFPLIENTLKSDHQRIRFSSLSVQCCPDFTFSCSNTVLTAQETHRYNKFYVWMDKVGIYLQI